MIHVNVRGLLIRRIKDDVELIIQLRKREGEPEVYELPGGRINEYEKITDALKREVIEETGLKVAAIQTIEGPVDSFGLYFMCQVEGTPLSKGDDSADIHWASTEEIQRLVAENKFSGIDLPAVLMFLRDSM